MGHKVEKLTNLVLATPDASFVFVDAGFFEPVSQLETEHKQQISQKTSI